MRRKKVDPPKRFNRIIFFFIELAYWFEYYLAKKKKDKMVSISYGVGWVFSILMLDIFVTAMCFNSIVSAVAVEL